jgi:hypothetical protein
MKRLIAIAIILSALAMMTGCGGSDTDTGSAENSGSQPEYDLVKVDSIGIDIGDSNYMFGMIIDVTYLVDGRIALLDILQQQVLVYSGDGEFLGRAGRGGRGPGEFVSPYSLTFLSDGGFAVSDIQQAKVVFFGSDLGYLRELSGFPFMAPDRISCGPDGSITGRIYGYYWDEDAEEYFSGAEFCLWSDSIEPDITFLESYYSSSSDDRVSYNFGSNPEGQLVCALSSKTDYSLVGYTSAGDTSFTVDIPWETTYVTQEELDVARPYAVIPGPGSDATSAELSSNWVPDSVRSAAVIVGFDGEGRLWVKSGKGADASPVFDLYDMSDGSFITSSETTLPAIARYWGFKVSESGILGWDHNPSDYTRVYILKLVERD